jgi:hypothetical protein
MRGNKRSIRNKSLKKRDTAGSIDDEWSSFSAEFEFSITYLELKPFEFWELTPAEFYEMAEGYNKRHIKRSNELITLAWNTAALVRTKEMPELESILISDVIKEAQTDDEMLSIVKMLNAAFGGEVVEV